MRFPYTGIDGYSGSLMPRLEVTLHNNGQRINIVGLLDTGSTVNVLPFSVGIALGAVWDDQPVVSSLVGSLQGVGVKALDVFMSHPKLVPTPSIQLVFAWAKTDKCACNFWTHKLFHGV